MHKNKIKQYRETFKKNHPDKIKEYNRKARLRKYNRIKELKNKPCMDCGKFYPPYVMDFDHVRGEKKFDLSRLSGKAVTLKEITKCELVCANCHRIRTHLR